MKDMIGTYVRIADCASMAQSLYSSSLDLTSVKSVRDALVQEAVNYAEWNFDNCVLDRVHDSTFFLPPDYEEDF